MRILIDGREFVCQRFTGIGRILEGLTDALAESDIADEIILAVYNTEVVPHKLRNRPKIHFRKLSPAFIASEKRLSDLSSKNVTLFLSPYPKLPLFGTYCPSVHIIHDVLDLTHPEYKKRFKVYFDTFRLKHALKKAHLTWYDSRYSMEETKKLAKVIGINPRVRYPGIEERFKTDNIPDENKILSKHHLESGYILVTGNGLPHKNLGILLRISKMMNKKFVFVGVSQANQNYWKTLYPEAKAAWITYIGNEDLPVIIRGAFCVAQPSTAEGYGYPPLEAMACGIPAVISNIPVLIETTGANALFAEPDVPETWLQAFECLQDKDVYQSLVDKGLAWVTPLRGQRGWKPYLSDIKELLNTSHRGNP